MLSKVAGVREASSGCEGRADADKPTGRFMIRSRTHLILKTEIREWPNSS